MSLTSEQGFPLSTPVDEARATALATYRAVCEQLGRVPVAEPRVYRVDTDKHTENGEYLMVVSYDRRPDHLPQRVAAAVSTRAVR